MLIEVKLWSVCIMHGWRRHDQSVSGAARMRGFHLLGVQHPGGGWVLGRCVRVCVCVCVRACVFLVPQATDTEGV